MTLVNRLQLDVPEKKTLLLVDDDPVFLYAAEKHFVGAGFTVITCRDALHTIDELRRIAVLHCMILDIRLPAGTPHGIALAHMVQKRFPGVPVIFTSGYAEAGRYLRPPDGKLFAKPVDFDAVTAEIHALIDYPALDGAPHQS